MNLTMRMQFFLGVIIISIIIINIPNISSASFIGHSIKGNSQTSEQIDHIYVRLTNVSWLINGPDSTGNNTLVSFTSWGQMYINGTKNITIGVNKCLWPWFTALGSPINLKSAPTLCYLVIVEETFSPNILYNFSGSLMDTISLKEINRLPIGNYSFVPIIGLNTSSVIWYYYGLKLIVSSNESSIISDQFSINWSTIPSFNPVTTTPSTKLISVSPFPLIPFILALVLVTYVVRNRKTIRK